MKTHLIFFCIASILISSCAKNKSFSRYNELPAASDTLVKLSALPPFKSAYILQNDSTIRLMHFVPFRDDEDSSEINSNGQGESYRTMILPPSTGYCDSENFDGSYRKAAKIDICTAPLQNYNSLGPLLSTLQSDASMASHSPPITTSTNRVTEELRNVNVKSCYLCCFAKQTDEDFHVIIATSKNWNTAKFFNAEISGLPPSTSADFSTMKDVRTNWMQMIDEVSLCSGGYYFYETPERIKIKGSLFFDKQHFGDDIGPAEARPKTAWEIHPISFIDWY